MTMPELHPPRPTVPAPVERLYWQHQEKVLAIACRITGSLRDAEDVLHTLFLRLLRRGDQLAPETLGAAYFHRAAVNLSLDVLRARREQVAFEAVPEPADHVEPAPDEARRLQELGGRLRGALAELSPKAAEMFVLHHLEGWSNKEIARSLGTSWSVVAVSLHRTRSRLRRRLTQAGPPAPGAAPGQPPARRPVSD